METREFRSRLNTLPLELKCAIGEIPYQKGMRHTSRREKIIEYLKAFNIPYIELGTGTNRFIIKYDGYALKIALDNEGIADNRQEWVMSQPLGPGAAPAYEISKGGNLLVSHYNGAFSSYSEFLIYRKEIYAILHEWNAKGFLLGDVGITKKNFANWGLSSDNRPVCIDYAYIFPANMDLFECTCGSNNMQIDEYFTEYHCIDCGKHFDDREIRMRISNETREKLFSDVVGIEMTTPTAVFPIDDKYIIKESMKNPDVISDEEVALRMAQFDISGRSGNWYK